MSGEEAAAAVHKALLACIGPGAAEELAFAQARLAWQEVVGAAGLTRSGMRSRLVTVVDGVGRVQASEPILAQELTLRADSLAAQANERMRGRPGATIELQRLVISVSPAGDRRSL